MRTYKLPAVLAVVLAGVACSDTLTAPVTTWSGPIAVANETPAPTGSSSLAGTASVTLGANSLTYTINLTGTPTSAITAVHIHGGTAAAGAAGTTAAVRINICGASTIATDNRTSAAWSTCAAGAQTLNGTVTWASGSSLLAGNAATPPNNLTYDQMALALRAYNMYVNVHTTTNGAGEARAQLLPPPVTP